MARPRNDWIDYLQYLALRAVHMVMHCWPVAWNLEFACMVGYIMYRFDKRHRLRAIGNLTRSFPHYPRKRIEAMALQSMQQTLMLGVEVMFTTRLIRMENFTRYIRLGDFGESLKLLMDRHNGLIVLTGHYGNWEILGYTLATLGFRTVSVARPLDNKYVNEWVLGVRERKGQRIVDKKGATAITTATLEAKGTVGIIADQNAGPKGLFVDFFGRKASTHKSIGLLAMQYNVPIVIGYARRLGRNFTFQIGTQDIIYPQDWATQDQPLHYITQRYTKAIEDFVTEDPGQYLWLHRRWKTRPKGEAPEQYD
ncbi:MAG TPA: lysophospholipid acyltransferase family protein [Tepidisphaeraceae bacterium]